MGAGKLREDNAREIVDALDELIVKRIRQVCDKGLKPSNQLDEECEIIKRALTDYFLLTDPRKGIYVRGEHG